MSWMSPSYIQLPIKDRGGWEDQWRLFLYREKGWDVNQTVGPSRCFLAFKPTCLLISRNRHSLQA